MRNNPSRSHRRALAVFLAAGLWLLVLAGPVSARSLPGGNSSSRTAQLAVSGGQSPTSTVSVVIDTITPLSPGPKDTLRVGGRVIDQLTTSLTDVQVSLHLGASVASRTELHGLRAAPVDQQLATPTQLVADGNVSPGHSLRFTITTPMSKLELPSAGVYPMYVLATGIEQAGNRPIDLARANTFLPYIPTQQTSPASPLSWVIPLTADPSLLADGTFAGDGVVQSTAPGARLSNLLDALSSARAVTAIIDPAVIQALAVAANQSYVVAAGNGSPAVKKKASADARNWLARLRAAGNTTLIGLPYADPDIEALLHAGQRPLAEDARARTPEVLSLGLLTANRRLTTDVAVPPRGLVDAAGARYYESAAHASALLLSGGAVPATGDNPSASARVPGVSARLLLNDDVLSGLVTAGPTASPRVAEQNIIAELAEAHLEDRFVASPSQDGQPPEARPLLIAPPAGWNAPRAWLSRLLSDTARLHWISQVPVTFLLGSSAESRAGLQYPAAARNAELPASLVADSAQLASAAGGLFRTPLPGEAAQPRTPDSIIRPIRDATLAAVSSRWRTDASRADVFEQSAAHSFSALQQGVRVVASPQVTLTSRSGKVPVTLENDLAAAVDVSLVLTSQDRSRVTSNTVVHRTVRAGQKVQVEVEVHAASAGTFPIRLALFSPGGQPLGTPAQVLVRSTKYGVVATLFTVVALSVLSLAVLFRGLRALVRRARGSRRGPTTPARPAAGS